MITTNQLVSFLASRNVNAGLIDKLKIVYRPYICPLDKILNFIKPKANVFDIGCGSGQFALLVAEYASPNRIMGIEMSNSLVKNAQSLLEPYNHIQTSFKAYDGKNLPEEIRDFNTFSMIDVFHHIPKTQQVSFMKNLYEVMPENSRLIFKDMNAASIFVYASKLHDMILVKQIGKEISFKKAKQMLKDIGFKIIYTEKQLMYWYAHYTIVVQK